MNTCQTCLHIDVCYFSKTLCEIVTIDQDMFPDTRESIMALLDGAGQYCRHYKERKNDTNITEKISVAGEMPQS